MKKVIKTNVLMVAMFTMMLNNANANNFIPLKKEFKETTLTLNNVKKGHRLLIKDLNGLVLYKEFIQDSGSYYKGFDLTSLPSGDYYFELDKDLEIKIIPFNVTSNDVVFDKKNETSIFKPTVRVKNNKVFISKLSLDLKPFEIKVYQENPGKDYLLYSETIENTKVIERLYTLPENQKVSYKIIFKTEGREFVEHINI